MRGLERLRWWVLALLFTSTAINYIDRQALAVLLPTLRGELNLTAADYGTISTLFLASYTVGQLVMGAVVDRLGTRLGLTLAIIAWSLASMGHALVGGFTSLLALRIVLGLGESGNWPAGAKAVSEWFPKHRRAFAMGVLDGGSAIGAVLAPPLVAWLAHQYGWRAAFLATGAIGFLWLAAWIRSYWPPREHRGLNEEERARAAEEIGPAGKTLAFGAGVKLAAATPVLWGLMVTRMVATPVWWFYVFWLPDYLSKGRGFTLAEIGMFGWIPFLTVDLGKLAGGAASDRLLARGWPSAKGRKTVMAAGAVLMMAGLAVEGAPTAAAAIAWVSVATFGFGIWSANILALHSDFFPSEAMASAVGMTTMAASIGGACFTWWVGRTVDTSGYEPVFAAAGLLALGALISLMALVRQKEDAR
jgi:ACS family hexuronate transporter-like MFS transporter